jgi:hypothetical protein
MASLVIIGVTGRQLKQETEIAIAYEDAARKAALYHGMQVSVEIIQNIGAGFLDYFVNSEFNLEYDKKKKKDIDKLTFDPKRDVISRDNGVFVYFTYPVAFPGKILYTIEKNPNGSPGWTTRPPHDINGFIAGVGFARKQQKLKDTFTKSYEAAIASLVSRSSASVTTSETSFEHGSTTFIQQRSKGNLTHFVVLETWMDPENESVWTLAIAQNGTN